MTTRCFCFTVLFLLCLAASVLALDDNSVQYDPGLPAAELESASPSENIESFNNTDELAEKPQIFAVKVRRAWRHSRIYEKACAANKRLLLMAVEQYNLEHQTMMNRLDLELLVKQGCLKKEVKCPAVYGDAYVGYNLAGASQLDEGSMICLYHGSIKAPVDYDSLGTDKAFISGLPSGSKVVYSMSMFDMDSMKMIVLLGLKWIVFPLIFSVLYVKTFKSIWPRLFHALFVCLGISASLCVLFPPSSPVSRFAGDFFEMFAVHDVIFTWMIAVLICFFSSSVLPENYKMLILITIFVMPLILFFAPALVPFISLCVILSELTLILNVQQKPVADNS